mmetsp:Transcript_38858/g.103186  ORF Transcript_38858/g.103186 Transcript_38858/m.103186 type:complete len:149 (-) Transcript_38858:297-743(-)
MPVPVWLRQLVQLSCPPWGLVVEVSTGPRRVAATRKCPSVLPCVARLASGRERSPSAKCLRDLGRGFGAAVWEKLPAIGSDPRGPLASLGSGISQLDSEELEASEMPIVERASAMQQRLPPQAMENVVPRLANGSDKLATIWKEPAMP